MMPKIRRQLSIRKALLRASWQISTANMARQVAMVISVILFNIALLISLKGTFAGLSTKLIGGYNYSELVFILFLFEISYYVSQAIFMRMFGALPQLINRGDLDLYLIRPAKLKIQLRYENMNLPWLITSFIIISLMMIQQINFSQISVNLIRLPMGILVISMGVMAYETIFFVLASSAFWFGEAKRILHIGFSLNRPVNPPMSASPNWFLLLNLILLPISFAAILGAQILLKQFGGLEKTYFAGMAIITLINIIFQKYWWRVCLKKYSSASS